MDDLVENEHGCVRFEPNPFKQAQCKSCRSPWYQHKGAIDEELLCVFVESRRKANEDKQRKGEQEKREARAKKRAKKKNSGAVEDAWLREGTSPAEGNDMEVCSDSGDASDGDGDGDAGFRMLEVDQSHRRSPERMEAQPKVVNLVDFAECDIPEEESQAGSVQLADVGSGSCGAGGQAELAAAAAGFESQSQEVEYLRLRLASVNEEKRLEMEILQEKVSAEQAVCGQLRQELSGLQSSLLGTQENLPSLAEDVPRLLDALADGNTRKLDVIERLLERIEELERERDGKDLALKEALARNAQLEAEADKTWQALAAARRPEARSADETDVEEPVQADVAAAIASSLPARSTPPPPPPPTAAALAADSGNGINGTEARQLPAQQPPAPPPRAPPSPEHAAGASLEQPQGPAADLETAEQAAASCLDVCSRLTAAAGAVVESLSSAGSGLQHVLNPREAGAGIASLAEHEDRLVRRSARFLLIALRSVSVALIDLAASLSSEVEKPLEVIVRSVAARRAARTEEVEQLRQRRQVSTDAITASLQRSQALAQQAQTPVGAEAILGWFSGAAKIDEPELRRLQQVEQRAIEEHRDQIMALMHTEQVVTAALSEHLGQVDSAMKTALSGFLAQFPNAWVKSTGTLHRDIQTLCASA